jgi:Zn-dependent protease
MRDPMSWALPLFRAFGIQVKVHIFFFIITIGLFLRVVLDKYHPIWWVDVFLFTVVLLFGIILLHEFGHAFGARAVGGDSKEILIWPLGGLAFVEVPHNPRALFIVTAAGPGVNVAICVAAAAALAVGGFLPSLNPISNPYVSEIHNFRDGRDYTSAYGFKAYKPGTAELVPALEAFENSPKEFWEVRGRMMLRPADAEYIHQRVGGERTVAPAWAVWLNRTFWLSWVLFLFNLIPAYPLDGGQLLQALIWGRRDYRTGVIVASYSGFVVSVIFLIVSIWQNEALFMGLALFMLYSASLKLHMLEAEDGPFGYDFSAGYTSLEKDDEPPPRPKRPGFFTRWWQARKARKLARELEQRQKDEQRMDQLLEKIAQSGKNSLTDEEQRFLERVSARYRNRS